jgi:hypothetical protein
MCPDVVRDGIRPRPTRELPLRATRIPPAQKKEKNTLFFIDFLSIAPAERTDGPVFTYLHDPVDESRLYFFNFFLWG